MNAKYSISSLIFAATLPCLCMAESATNLVKDESNIDQKFYAGLNLGYANTDWSMLQVDENEMGGSQLAMSLPIGAQSDGFAYGVSLGYTVNEYFSAEATYTRFSNSKIILAAGNGYTNSPGDDNETLISKTSAFDLSAKFTIPVPVISNMQAYSSVGIAAVHRFDDKLTVYDNDGPTGQKFGVDTYRVGGVFGAGLIYNFSKHFFCQTAFKYYTGYGRPSAKPVQFYSPFIYMGNVMLAVRF